MTSTREIVEKVLNFGDKEFFAADASVLSPREAQLLELDFSGVAANAPRRIVISDHGKLPLIMALRCSGERDWDVDLTDNCMLVATNLLDGTVRVTNALLTEKDLTSRGGRIRAEKGPKPAGLAEVSSQLTEIDVRRRLNLEWKAGTWALGVAYFDWPSNTVVVQLEGGSPAPNGPVRPVRPSYNPAALSAMKQAGKSLPSYYPTTETPASPESGVTFGVDFRMKQGRQSLVVTASFAVPVKEFHIPKQEIVHEYQDGRREKVQAILPVTLAMLKLDHVWPWQFDWAVPVYGEPSAIGTIARGYFAIDALASEDSPLSAGSYVCYIVADGRIFGPRKFQVPENR